MAARVCEYLQFFSRLLVRLAIALRDGGGGGGCNANRVPYSTSQTIFRPLGLIRRSFIERGKRKHGSYYNVFRDAF